MLPLDIPSYALEAIDWILRVTVKDTVSGGGDGNGAEGLANSVNDLISTVGIKEIKPPIKIDQTLIDNLATGLAKFVGYDDIKKGQIGDKGIAGVPRGGQANTKNKHPTPWTQEELNKERSSIRIPKGYVYSYEPKTTQWNNQWDNGSHAGAQKCAKIFLACLPMIFSALSYLYWRCSRGYIDDGWQSMSLKDSGLNAGLSYFISGHGFRTSELNGKIAGSGVVSAMTDDNFKDFKTALDQANTVATTRANSENAARTKLGIGQSYMPSHMPRKPFTPVPANNKPTYREFLHELRENGKENSGSSITTNAKHNSFSILFHISCLYFTAKQKRQSTDPAFKPRSPSTIREMLYFLAAFTYSTSYDTLNAHISNHFKNLVPDPDGKTIQEDKRHDAELMIPVADASSPNTNNTLSAADLKDYLLATCLYCPAILCRLQGNSADSGDEPWLHSLFSNTQFSLGYPSGSALLYNISNYAYALQFQLSFLYQQCSLGSAQGRRWRQCKYGQSITPNVKSKSFPVPSHICLAPCQETNKSDCHHNSKTCKHGDQCGNDTSSSPLQAFLTDNLKGFSIAQHPYPSSTNHLDNHPSGSMCHVKMGFQSTDLRTAGSGHYIYFTLDNLCGYTYSPLPQLSEKLGCLTKRTPRTLGDIFGFIWYLNEQLFTTRPTLNSLISKLDTALGINGSLSNTFTTDPYAVITKIWNHIAKLNPGPLPSSSTGLSRSLSVMAPATPFLYQIIMMKDPNTLPGAIFDLTQHCHNLKHDEQTNEVKHLSPDGKAQCSHSSSNPAGLWSLYNPVGDKAKYPNCSNKNCVGYHKPLTTTYGAAFSPSSASAYLSWIAYLTDDLFEWLSAMLDEFINISCEHCGAQCNPGKSFHATPESACSCPSVVQCSGVLPLLYSHGFQFHDAYSLNGTTTKRTCQQFHDQLSNVLSPDAPLAKLLLAIDEFLYYVRFRFMSMVSSFWLCSLASLLYFIFYGIDVLHFKSHILLPSSHTVPPISLLTTGKAPALTKLTYYTP